MPHLATKINCDGDKCGRCDDRDHRGAYAGKTMSYCKRFFKYIKGEIRLPECLAAELVEDCDTCAFVDTSGNKEPCKGCLANMTSWQPATKGER